MRIKNLTTARSEEGSRDEIPCQGHGDEIPIVPHARSAHKQESEWDRSLPPPVAETGRRSVGNRKERWYIATMRVSRAPKATITILIHFDRTLLLIPAGCALRWAQKDEGGILGFPPTSLWTPIPPPKRLRGISTVKYVRFSLNARVRRSRNCALAP